MDLHNKIYDKLEKIDTNLCTSVQIFLAVPAIAALIKRSFTKLKLRNNDLRTRMSKAIFCSFRSAQCRIRTQ